MIKEALGSKLAFSMLEDRLNFTIHKSRKSRALPAFVLYFVKNNNTIPKVTVILILTCR